MKLNLYSLIINGETVCEVSTDYDPALPIRPQLNKAWLRQLVAQALRRCFTRNQQKIEVVRV